MKHPSTATSAPGVRERSPWLVDARTAAQDSWVIWLGIGALGTAFGLLVTSSGLAWWWAPVISTFVFAGSLEFVLIGLLVATVPLVSVAVTAALLNSRHAFYGLAFPLHRVNGRARTAYSMFALTDEAYALTATRPADSMTSGHIISMQIGLHASWVTGSLVGSLLGASILGGLQGLEFTLTALFVVLTLDASRAGRDIPTVVLALVCALVARIAMPELMLVGAMSMFLATLVARHFAAGAGRVVRA
jgi:4-azaleucine resistance transporter AzlC